MDNNDSKNTDDKERIKAITLLSHNIIDREWI